MAKELIFDTETTGLFANTVKTLDKLPEIFEFFGLILDTETYETIAELHLFSRPRQKMEAGASKATGKKDEDFINYPPFADNASQIKEFIESADAVVAHNEHYDHCVIDFEFNRLQSKVNWPEHICTVEKTEWIDGFRLSLTALYQKLFNKDFDGKHSAIYDVYALRDCYIELLKRNWI